MKDWYPEAIRDEYGVVSGGSMFTTYPWRGVLHTTESANYTPGQGSYWGNAYWPHFTPEVQNGVFQVYQHLPLSLAARALVNQSGGVETNRQRAIQIEICWTAVSVQFLPQAMIDGLKRLMRWIEAQTGIAPAAPAFQAYPASYGPKQAGGNLVRFTDVQWNFFNGWCGHQHVPENVHGDPGLIPIAKLIAVDAAPVVDHNVEDGLVRQIGNGAGAWIMFSGYDWWNVVGNAQLTPQNKSQWLRIVDATYFAEVKAGFPQRANPTP